MQELPGGADIPYGIWDIPAAQMVFHLSLDVVDRLSRDVMEGFKSVPRRGLEVGGVLLGRVEPAEPRAIVTVDAAEPLECEHARGPSLFLSEGDRRALDDFLAARAGAPDASLRVVGFYRSQTRGEALHLDVEDAAVMMQHFRGVPQLFLLIRPAPVPASTAALFLWDGEQFAPQAACLEFPFQRSELLAGGCEVVYAPAASASPQQQSARRRPLIETMEAGLRQELQADSAAARPALRAQVERCVASAREWIARHPLPHWNWRALLERGWLAPWQKLPHARRWAMPAAVVVLLAAAGGLALRLARPAHAPMPASLSLRLERDQDALRLRWDRTAPAIAHAHGAVLWITDGPRQSRLNLDTSQLRQGSVAYWPASDDVNFRLEVLGPPQSVSESIRGFGLSPRPAVPAAPPPVLAEAKPAPVPPGPPVKRARRSRPSPFGGEPDDEEEPLHPTSTSAPATIQPAREPAPAPAAPEPRPEPKVERTSVKAAEPPVVATLTFETAEPTRAGRVLGKIPLIRRIHRNRNAGTEPPRPLDLYKPAAPPEVLRTFAGELPVDIKLHIGATGKVEDAELLSGISGPRAKLADLALHAARRCQFTPARAGDRAVPSEVVLHYRFTGTAPELASRP